MLKRTPLKPSKTIAGTIKCTLLSCFHFGHVNSTNAAVTSAFHAGSLRRPPWNLWRRGCGRGAPKPRPVDRSRQDTCVEDVVFDGCDPSGPVGFVTFGPEMAWYSRACHVDPAGLKLPWHAFRPGEDSDTASKCAKPLGNKSVASQCRLCQTLMLKEFRTAQICRLTVNNLIFKLIS